jgi:hypothetical protein
MIELGSVVCLLIHLNDGRVRCYQKVNCETFKLLPILGKIKSAQMQVCNQDGVALVYSETIVPVMIT